MYCLVAGFLDAEGDPMEPSADTIHEKIFNEIEGRIVCPFCGNENWTSYDDVAVVGTQQAGKWHEYGNSIAAVGSFCDGCGFIRLHAISSKTFADLGSCP